MSKYKIPKNREYPLTKAEKDILLNRLEELELEAYHTYRHELGGFSEVKVLKYDQECITVVVKSGFETQTNGVIYTETDLIFREDLIDD
jgi:hypothetical protein